MAIAETTRSILAGSECHPSLAMQVLSEVARVIMIGHVRQPLEAECAETDGGSYRSCEVARQATTCRMNG